MLKFEGRIASYYRFRLKLGSIQTKSKIYISKGSLIANGTSIGFGTRINGPIIVKGKGMCVMGNYCALGDAIRIITSNHSTKSIILQYALLKRLGRPVEEDTKIGVTIGDNVWIGDAAIILPGVKIGSHSVVAAGAVVTKEVPAYGIVGGNPARLIRYRLDESLRDKLSNTEWPKWTESEIKRWLKQMGLPD